VPTGQTYPHVGRLEKDVPEGNLGEARAYARAIRPNGSTLRGRSDWLKLSSANDAWMNVRSIVISASGRQSHGHADDKSARSDDNVDYDVEVRLRPELLTRLVTNSVGRKQRPYAAR